MTAVFRDYDQVALDAAYDQTFWAANRDELLASYADASARCRDRLGPPLHFAYGPTPAEGLDVFRAASDRAPVMIFVHGGAWRGGAAADYAFPAEMFVAAGVHYVALDFAAAPDVGGDLRVMASQVQRAILWLHDNAERFGGEPERLYLAGHSSGAHLAAVALTADWRALGAPPDIVKGGVLVSGMYDLHPVRLSSRSRYVAFDDNMVQRLSPIRHVDRLSAPLTVAWGSRESPEFIRQGRDFAAAVNAAAKPVEVLVAEGTNHFEMMATLSRA
ncbi:MAG: alpha/beta hydrolase, partial [Stellaceae bacterium]